MVEEVDHFYTSCVTILEHFV